MDPVSKSVADAIERLELTRGRLVVAVSGGLDSSVLLHSIVRACTPFEVDPIVAHVNHGLRGADSELDQKVVEAQASAFGLTCRVCCVDVEDARRGHSSRTRPTRQEAARNLRRDALMAIADDVGAARIATAHHLDDQAETVFMRVLRGASGDGLGGIAEVSRDGRFVRPLLGVGRQAIEAYAQAHGVVWREDASNQDPRYTRNRLRNEVLPTLRRDFNPQLPRALANLARSQRRDAEWIATIVDDAFDQRFRKRERGGYEIGKSGWSELPEALATRLVARAFESLAAGRDQNRLHIERAVAFLSEGPSAHGGREIEFPGGLRLRRTREKFLLYRIPSEIG